MMYIDSSSKSTCLIHLITITCSPPFSCNRALLQYTLMSLLTSCSLLSTMHHSKIIPISSIPFMSPSEKATFASTITRRHKSLTWFSPIILSHGQVPVYDYNEVHLDVGLASLLVLNGCAGLLSMDMYRAAWPRHQVIVMKTSFELKQVMVKSLLIVSEVEVISIYLSILYSIQTMTRNICRSGISSLVLDLGGDVGEIFCLLFFIHRNPSLLFFA